MLIFQPRNSILLRQPPQLYSDKEIPLRRACGCLVGWVLKRESTEKSALSQLGTVCCVKARVESGGPMGHVP